MSALAPILYYHSIGRDAMSVHPRSFERQMRHLARQGMAATSVSGLLDAVDRGEPSDQLVGLTFDDGFAGVHEHALPVLRELGFSASLFLPVEYIGATLWADADDDRWHAEAAPGRIEHRMMSLDAARAWVDADLEVGSHSYTHPNLPDVSPQQLRREVRDSRARLALELGCPIRGFCYPRGRVDASIIAEVGAAGYEWAVTTRRGRAHTSDDRHALPRLPGGRARVDLQAILSDRPPTIAGRIVRRAGRIIETSLDRLGRGT